MNCGLCAKELEIIQEILSHYEAIQSAVLFGSSVTGNFKTASDIDIALKGAITIKLIAKIKAEFEDSNLPFFVDIVDYAKADNALKNEIDTQGVMLYPHFKVTTTAWQRVKLGEVAEIKYGKSHQILKNGKFLAYGSGGIIRKVDSCIYDKESVLIPRKGSLNNIFYTNKPFWVVDTMFYTIINNDIIVPKFLFYCLKIIDFDNLNVGSAVPSLTIQILDELRLCIPPLETQHKIAEILSSLDDKIDLLHRQNKTLESLALTLFRHTFIENPKRNAWQIGKLGDWLQETIGGDWGKEKPDNDFQEKVFCIRGTDIADLNKGLADKTPIRYIKKNKLSMLEPKEGDIIFEISGGTETQSTGRCVFVNQQVKILFEYPIVFSNFCRLLRVKKKEYSYFLYLYLQYLYHSDEFFALENGTSGIKNLSYKALFYELEYKMPSEIQVIEFHTKVKIYFDKINANKKQIQNLQSLRDIMLPKLLSGEIEV